MQAPQAAVLAALAADEAAHADDFGADPHLLLLVGTGGTVTAEHWPVPAWFWGTLGVTTGVVRLAEAVAALASEPEPERWLTPLGQLVRADYLGTGLLVCGIGVERAPADLVPLDAADLDAADDAVPVRRLYAVDRHRTEYLLVRPQGRPVQTHVAASGDVAGGHLLDGHLSDAVRRVNESVLTASYARAYDASFTA